MADSSAAAAEGSSEVLTAHAVNSARDRDSEAAKEQAEKDERLQCRFYEQEFPNIDECVIVTVNSIAEMGAYVTLVEYNNLEGMILLSELSRRRIRSISKLIRVGKTEIAMVMRVDKEKGYIDLSKRRVSKEEAEACEDRFNKGKIVHGIVRQIAETTHRKLEDLMQMIAWPLGKKYKTAFDAFQLAVSDDSVLKSLELPEEILRPLMSTIKRKMTPQPVRIRADIDVTCFTEIGIDGVREALLTGERAGTEDIPLKIKLIAPPSYVILTTSLNKARGIEVMTQAIEAITAKIKEAGGKIVVKQDPHATTQEDEHNLAAQLQQIERENEEVDADEDAEFEANE